MSSHILQELLKLFSDGYNHVMMQRKDIAPALTRTIIEPVVFDNATASAEFVISTDSPDRDNDIVVPDGCLPHLHTYKANPVVLFDHGSRIDYPIAMSEVPDTKACTVVVEKNRIRAKAYFHCETLESQQCCRLTEKKILRGASIGYRGIRAEQIIPGRKSGGNLFTEWELLEWSIVPIPANQDALRIALSAKWEGKALAEPIARKFKSLLLPSKKLIFPVRVQLASKRMKAMPDEIVEQTTEEIAEESSTLPAGAQGINILLQGMTQLITTVKESVPAIENPQVLKLIDKFLSKGESLLSEVQSGASSIYPDIFTEGEAVETEDEEETEVEETTDDTETTEEVKEDEVKEDDEDDVSATGKSFKLKKNFQKACADHVASVSDAVEFADEVAKSDNIPSGIKRQAKGILPGLKSVAAFLNKSGEADEEKVTDTEEEKYEDTDEEKQAAEEEEKAALAELQKITQVVSSNAKQLASLKGAK